VGALDWSARKVALSVTDYAAGGRQGPSRAFFVTNTDDYRSGGLHWISVWPSLCDGISHLLSSEFSKFVWCEVSRTLAFP